MQNDRQVVVAVDAMGSDLGPREVMEGVRRFLGRRDSKGVAVVAVGDGAILGPMVESPCFSKFSERLSLHHAGEIIAMDESPTWAIRHKKDASMARAVELVCTGAADAVLSCGNTGALVALGTIRIRPMDYLERPALGAVIPAFESHFILLDVGANPTPTARQLVKNAILGSHYCRMAMGIELPRVGLLSIGTEDGKGTESVQVAHDELKKITDFINYVGLVEGFQLFSNEVDVVVCDGFVGNVLLKAMESIAKQLKSYFKKELFKNPLRILGCLFLRGAIGDIRGKLRTDKYGGAPLLGLNKPVFKAHGSSDCRAIEHAIAIAARFVREENMQNLRESIEKAEEFLSTSSQQFTRNNL
ncbi:MAG: phosphate acyltransferase PlsX [Puniceicoccales bacterium]|jgi:glycerol-3-phosphate acyltransferase PlsX|nr:phosphate acyltransferase PlsX [Puniceicoccales bacterium]